MVLSPYLKYKIQCLDNVQNHFLHFMAFKSNITRVLHFPYQTLLYFLDTVGLPEKREINCVTFYFNL